MAFVSRRASSWFILGLCLVLSSCAGKKKPEDPKAPATNPQTTNTQQTGGVNGGSPGQLPDGGPLLPAGAAQVAQTAPTAQVAQLPSAQTTQQKLEDMMVAPP